VGRPQELVAINVASGAIESASFVIGPATAGLLIAASGPGLVFLAMAGVVGLSALLVARLSVVEEAPAKEEGPPDLVGQSVDGLRRLARQPDAVLLVALVASQALAIGALDVLARAFGAMEGLLMAALALGSISASGLVAGLGGRGALLVTGVVLPAVAAASWWRLRRIEVRTEPPREVVALLRGVPVFAPLP